MDSRPLTVWIVDDDQSVRWVLEKALKQADMETRSFERAEHLLDAIGEGQPDVLITDVRMPGMSGLELQKKLTDYECGLPVIIITSPGDVPMAVEAMRRGAVDFIRKPFREHDLLDRINEALNLDDDIQKRQASRQKYSDQLASLSEREWQVFERVADGEMNKVIAADLGISERTVEVHRGQVMRKLGVKTLAQLVRFKIESEVTATR